MTIMLLFEIREVLQGYREHLLISQHVLLFTTTKITMICDSIIVIALATELDPQKKEYNNVSLT